MKSFIPWVGGKNQLKDIILGEFPKDGIDRYIEVFGGAGWLLFARDKHAQLEVFNDRDGQLVNLYRCIQYHCEELQRELRLGGEQIPFNSRQLFDDFMAQLNGPGLTDIQRAARYYYIIRTSYGAARRTYGCNKKALHSSIDRLGEIQARLERVVIENRDFEVVIKTYDRPSALLYLDPPYFKAEECYEGFGPDDHQRLRDAAGRLKGRFVLSYNDAPEIRQLYEGYTIIPVERANPLAHAQGAGGKSYKELIIKNF